MTASDDVPTGSDTVTPARGRDWTTAVCMLVVLLLSALAWAPLLYPGFVQTHSGLGAIYDALGVGSPLSGWMPSYATAGDGPLATWAIALVGTITGLLNAVRLTYAVSFALSGAGMYLLARRLWGDWAAIAAAAVYMLLPYHLSVVYVRGSVAESALFALAPFLFLAVANLRRSPRWTAWLAAALLSVALVLTNAGLGALTVVMALLTMTVLTAAGDEQISPAGRRRPLLWAVTATLAGILGGALILLPAGAGAFANLAGWQDHFAHPFQLVLPVWGSGESVAGWQDGMSFQIGLVAIILCVLALWGAVESGDRTFRRAVLWLLALAGAPLVLMLTLSAWLWSIVPLAALVAYPWQLLAVAAVPWRCSPGQAWQPSSRLLTPPGSPCWQLCWRRRSLVAMRISPRASSTTLICLTCRMHRWPVWVMTFCCSMPGWTTRRSLAGRCRQRYSGRHCGSRGLTSPPSHI